MLVALALAAAAGGASNKQPVVVNIAHRGASGIAPEHTLAAYDLALEYGADFIEQDVQLTLDGELVVLHDETLDRTARGPAANCTGPVATKTLAQLKTCDMGSWFNEAFPERARKAYVGLRIPTLAEVLARYGRGANYYIETKSPEAQPGMEQALLRLLDEFGLRTAAVARWKVLIQSFSPGSLQRIHALDPSLPLIQLYPGGGSQAIRETLPVTATYAVGIGPAEGSVDAALIEAADALCLAVHPYTVNERQDLRPLVALGVDGVFTNFPRRLDAILGDRALPAALAASRAASASRACRTG